MNGSMQPASLSKEFKLKVAAEYKKNRKMLEELNLAALESFASVLLEIIRKEKEENGSSHDLEVLESSIRHLKRDAAQSGVSQAGTDEYDFARNDCSSLVESTKKWLELEGLI
jgi:hypothetical protein